MSAASGCAGGAGARRQGRMEGKGEARQLYTGHVATVASCVWSFEFIGRLINTVPGILVGAPQLLLSLFVQDYFWEGSAGPEIEQMSAP